LIEVDRKGWERRGKRAGASIIGRETLCVWYIIGTGQEFSDAQMHSGKEDGSIGCQLENTKGNQNLSVL